METKASTGCPDLGRAAHGLLKVMFSRKKKAIEPIGYLGEWLRWVGFFFYSSFGKGRIKSMPCIHKTKQTRVKLEKREQRQRGQCSVRRRRAMFTLTAMQRNTELMGNWLDKVPKRENHSVWSLSAHVADCPFMVAMQGKPDSIPPASISPSHRFWGVF